MENEYCVLLRQLEDYQLELRLAYRTGVVALLRPSPYQPGCVHFFVVCPLIAQEPRACSSQRCRRGDSLAHGPRPTIPEALRGEAVPFNSFTYALGNRIVRLAPRDHAIRLLESDAVGGMVDCII